MKNETLHSDWSLKSPMYLEPGDKRYAQAVKQLKKDGFTDSETWNLDGTICKFILPRLKRFRELHQDFPGSLTLEQWNEILDQMIFAFEFNLDIDEKFCQLSELEYKAEHAKYEEGLQLFTKYFRDLWW